MKRLGLILLAVVVLIGFLFNQAGAQTPLKGECYLVLFNIRGISWEKIFLDGKDVGRLSEDSDFLMNFECKSDKVLVELRSGPLTLSKQLTVIKGPAAHENPANKFIWQVEP